MLGKLVYAKEFSRDATQKCGEASLGFPCGVFLGNKKTNINPIFKEKSWCLEEIENKRKIPYNKKIINRS